MLMRSIVPQAFSDRINFEINFNKIRALDFISKNKNLKKLKYASGPISLVSFKDSNDFQKRWRELPFGESLVFIGDGKNFVDIIVLRS